MATHYPDDCEPLIKRRDDSSLTLEADTDVRPPRFGLSTLAKYCLVLEFLLELSNNVLTVPLISLFERAICDAYLDDNGQEALGVLGTVNEAACKIPQIQSELAELRGWKGFFETLAGTFVKWHPFLLLSHS